jgi:hypothetical protein
VFVVDGTMRTVGLAGRTTTIRDLKGCRYIARLIANPGREFHVLDLLAAETGVLRPLVAHPEAERRVQGGQAGLPVLDETAKHAYRRRLAEIDEDIEDAERMNDPERAALAHADREYLVAELVSAIGLGGRGREVGASAERARTSVTRSIRYAIEQLGVHHPELAGHLDCCITTGTYCSYQPDPVAPVAWRH